MRNRELLNRRLESLDYILTNLKRIVNTLAPVSEFKENIDKAENLVVEVKSMIAKEPLSPQEQNSSL